MAPVLSAPSFFNPAGERHFRACRRFVVYLAWTFLLLPFQLLFCALPFSWARRGRALIPILYHRGSLFIFNIKVEYRGNVRHGIAGGPAVLCVANHSTYLDIPVLGAKIAGAFVAKMEIARWPGYGLLARLQDTVFVNRTAFHQTAHQRDLMRERLLAGRSVILFPEGVSSDGSAVLPFKSALFSSVFFPPGVAKIRSPILVQPVSIAYRRLNGERLEGSRDESADAAHGSRRRDYVGWYANAPFLPHAWRMMGMRSLEAVVIFHEVVDPGSFPSRKALASHCREIVAHGLAEALAEP